MEIYCVNLMNEGKDPFEIIFSARSYKDAKNMINEKYPNCIIISMKEMFKS